MTIDTGGPAFPMPVSGFTERQPGMTMRDWFAGLALAAIGTWMPVTSCATLESAATLRLRAEWVYRQADAMIAAGGKGALNFKAAFDAEALLAADAFGRGDV